MCGFQSILIGALISPLPGESKKASDRAAMYVLVWRTTTHRRGRLSIGSVESGDFASDLHLLPMIRRMLPDQGR